MNHYFKLYSHNVIVRGKTQSALYDFYANKVQTIPHILHDFIKLLDKKSVQNVLASYSEEIQQYWKKYLKVLIDKNWGFYTNVPERYPVLSLEWYSPCWIESAVVEYDYCTDLLISEVAGQLNDLLCRHIQIVILKTTPSTFSISDIISCFDRTTIRSVVIAVSYHSIIPSELVTTFVNHSKLIKIICYNAPENGQVNISATQAITYSVKTYSELQISPSKLIVNRLYFTEALKHNPYYNRKVCIDRFGFVKNCLIHKQNFGSIYQQKISDIVHRNDFQELWQVNADQINDLKDSALRYAVFLTAPLDKTDGIFYNINQKENYNLLTKI